MIVKQALKGKNMVNNLIKMNTPKNMNYINTIAGEPNNPILTAINCIKEVEKLNITAC